MGRREGAGLVSSPSDRVDLQASAEPSADVRRAFVGGDVGALGQIFDHHSRSVWSVAMGVLRDRQLADEATQETFLRAWRAADRYDPARPLAPWLLTIARRTALDVIRRESRPTRGGHEPEQDVALNLPGIERAWETWEIKSALGRLPAEEREVVWFAHFHGMSHPQIADQLGVPVGTVKSRSFRAHNRLASMLSHVISEGGTSS
ncbi:MAG: sigma-70 family RNA polymerase sigma factor [Acidimicrobiia bacterium]|nr:sigma-70 family RNA polymerase sigma factor [Acidimicrobiia bacterium]